jgi:GNAT superfamily N-acetyltransferase
MNDPVRIRAATPSDAEAMRHCAAQAFGEYLPLLGKPPAPMLDDYEEIIQRHHAYVAELGDEVIAILVLIETPSGMSLDTVAVVPAHRGTGLGRRLIESAESIAHKLGYTCLKLHTNVLMTANVAMYERMGYTETHRGEEHGYQRVFMRKTV